MQEILPPHVEQAINEAWAVTLEQQAAAWKAARSESRSVTEAGVFVIRRPARRRMAAPSTGSRYR